MARIAQRSIFLEEQLDFHLLEDNSCWKSVKDKADNLQRSLVACREKCTDLQGRIRHLIDMKDTLYCQSIFEVPQSNVELLPGGTRIERMIMELKTETTECSVCTENVKKQQHIWSCKNCYNIFHLECAAKCMDATKRNGKWACPYCRDQLDVTVDGLRYTCFCERTFQPRSALNVTPHGCGQTCKRGCGSTCHPGPCTETASKVAGLSNPGLSASLIRFEK
ncbi:hypothetical protein GE061_016690 [Apolygus lucorum]|uniref:Uncharacterized protein n=1 Tax=Apolygus lucorum TaxID=248454 RepID=A0A6A4JSJ5_APOLU|nr:hypothetical protein GE061_016690 [Apolygus lucorum]